MTDPTSGPPAPTGGLSPMSERMQSLLSRAVEDQLSEQRQVAGALNEVRALLARLPQDVQAAVRAAADARGEQLHEGVSGLSSELRAGLRAVGERIDAVLQTVEQRAGEAVELRGRLADLQQQLAGQAGQLDALRSAFEALPSFPQQVAALREEVAALGERFGSLDDLHEELGTTTGRLSVLDELSRDLNGLRAAVDGVGERFDALAGADRVEALADLLRERLDDVGDDLEQARSAAAGVQQRLGALDERVASLATGEHVGDLHDRLDGLARRLDEVADGVGAAAATGEGLAELDSRLAELERASTQASARLDEVGRATDRLHGLADAVHDVADNAASVRELRDQVDVVRGLLAGESGIATDLVELRADLTRLSGRLEETGDGGAEVVTPDVVRSEVQAAVAASERRVLAHVDEAVLALAEALFRRRTRLASPTAPVVPEQAVQEAERAEGAADRLAEAAPEEEGLEQEDFEEEGEDLEEEEGLDEEDLEEDEGLEEPAEEVVDLADEDEERELAEQAVGEQQPPTSATAAYGFDLPPTGEPEPPRRRRPWWRPGD